MLPAYFKIARLSFLAGQSLYWSWLTALSVLAYLLKGTLLCKQALNLGLLLQRGLG